MDTIVIVNQTLASARPNVTGKRTEEIELTAGGPAGGGGGGGVRIV